MICIGVNKGGLVQCSSAVICGKSRSSGLCRGINTSWSPAAALLNSGRCALMRGRCPLNTLCDTHRRRALHMSPWPWFGFWFRACRCTAWPFLFFRFVCWFFAIQQGTFKIFLVSLIESLVFLLELLFYCFTVYVNIAGL